MDSIKKTIAKLSGMFLILVALVFSFNALATSQGNTAEPNLKKTDEAHVSFQRDKNYACTQCHKDEHDVLLGQHAKALNEKTGRNIGCIDCHNDISASHRDGAPNVVKFRQGQVVAGESKPAHDLAWVKTQNSQCIDCHQGEQLRKANWTHDVHALKLTCSSCHSIHPEKDPMQGIERKPRIKMCVDCHSDMTSYKQQEDK
ncbi:cytochrome c nitrite reductase pentaheme subunit [Vibrio litoralis]|uniref:cytochrome c nitrite reductase pentaheme subunit n=1 Tax=Vibrio litoralis TaxID=335972 RepID=UPI0004095F08|nr:cytochrome c nitrite reductase pentaheme subunit [Vibrio litoralis]